MDVLRCRFLEHTPGEIMCLSANNDLCLSVFLDSSILLYKTPHWVLLQTYPPTKSLDLRKVLWQDSNFFTAIGLSGLLLLYSTQSLQPFITCRVPGGGIWDFCKIQDKNDDIFYALACDDGVLRVYQYDEESFFIVNSFPKQDSKVLSTCESEGFLYAGTASGVIVKFNRKGQSLSRMSSESPIWVVFVHAGYVLTGEGNGNVSFWDGEKGILLQKIRSHEGDILCLCEKNGDVYASGVDSKVIRFSLNENEWIITGKAREQSHDIRTLTVVNEFLVSGGVTSDICIYPEGIFNSPGVTNWHKTSKRSNFRKTPVRHIATLPFNTPVHRAKNLVLHNLGNSLDLWSIDNDSQIVTKLASIRHKGNSGVTCSGISHSGKYIAYSSVYDFRLLGLNIDTFEIDFLDLQVPACSVLAFSDPNDQLYTAYTSLYFISLKTLLVQKIHDFSHFATKIACEGSACCVLLQNNQINIYKNKNFLFTLPTLEKAVSALNFGPHKSVFLVTEDNIMHGFNLKTQGPETFTSKYSCRFPKNYLNEINRTIGIKKFSKHSLIVHTHYSFTVIDLKKKPPKTCEILTKNKFPEHKNTWAGVLTSHSLHSEKKNPAQPPENNLENFMINKRFGPILDLSCSEEAWMICELDWEHILSIKPKPLAIHKYGT